MNETPVSRSGGPERRRRHLSRLALAIACLLMVQGVVTFERATHQDLTTLLADTFGRAKHSLAEAIRPDGDRRRGGEQAAHRTGDSRTDGSVELLDPENAETNDATSSTGPEADAPGPNGPTGGPARPGKLTPRSGPVGATPTTSAGSDFAGVPVSEPGATSASGSTAGPRLQTTPNTQAVDVATPPGSDPAPDPMVDLVQGLAGVVTRVRQLEFKSSVVVRPLGESEFAKRWNAQLNVPSGEAAVVRQGVFRALGIIGPQVDLFGEMRRLHAGVTPPSFYDAAADELVVAKGQIDAYGRSMLVRALARALDDQWFGIHRPALGTMTDQPADGFAALVEGTSRLVSGEYESALSATEQQKIEAERARRAELAPKDISPAVLALYNLQAKTGLPLAGALVQAGGQTRLNAAYAAPPTTTEQLITPSKYVRGEGAKAVGAPAADGAVIARGSLGQMGLLLMLNGVIVKEQAEQAAKGWDGDAYVVWRSGTKQCVRTTVRMETPDDDAQLSGALSQWAAKRSGAAVSGSGPFTFTRCA